MNKGLIISYFNRRTKTKYVSTSISDLSSLLHIHRNTLSGWIKEKGYYEDDEMIIFSIDPQELIHRPQNNNSTQWKKPDITINVHSATVNAHQPVKKKFSLKDALNKARLED